MPVEGLRECGPRLGGRGHLVEVDRGWVEVQEAGGAGDVGECLLWVEVAHPGAGRELD